MIAMIDWYCHHHSEFPQTPRDILAEWKKTGEPTRKAIPDKKTPPPVTTDGPEPYGTALTAEEGLWERKGWAGRPK